MFPFKKKLIFKVLAVKAKSTPLDYVIWRVFGHNLSPSYWSFQELFDSHWLDEYYANTTPGYFTIDQSYAAKDYSSKLLKLFIWQ
jgi:hypothetical protein